MELKKFVKKSEENFRKFGKNEIGEGSLERESVGE